MIIPFAAAYLTAIEGFIVSIPESVAILASAIVLVVTAVLLRRLLRRHEMEKGKDNIAKKA